MGQPAAVNQEHRSANTLSLSWVQGVDLQISSPPASKRARRQSLRTRWKCRWILACT